MEIKNECFYNYNVAQHDHYGSASVLLWGGISISGKTDLHVFHIGPETEFGAAMKFSILLLDNMLVPSVLSLFLWMIM